jgi:hypothetical protein
VCNLLSANYNSETKEKKGKEKKKRENQRNQQGDMVNKQKGNKTNTKTISGSGTIEFQS